MADKIFGKKYSRDISTNERSMIEEFLSKQEAVVCPDEKRGGERVMSRKYHLHNRNSNLGTGYFETKLRNNNNPDEYLCEMCKTHYGKRGPANGGGMRTKKIYGEYVDARLCRSCVVVLKNQYNYENREWRDEEYLYRIYLLETSTDERLLDILLDNKPGHKSVHSGSGKLKLRGEKLEDYKNLAERLEYAIKRTDKASRGNMSMCNQLTDTRGIIRLWDETHAEKEEFIEPAKEVLNVEDLLSKHSLSWRLEYYHTEACTQFLNKLSVEGSVSELETFTKFAKEDNIDRWGNLNSSHLSRLINWAEDVIFELS